MGQLTCLEQKLPRGKLNFHDVSSAEGQRCQGMGVLRGHLCPSDGTREAAPSIEAPTQCSGCSTDQNTWEDE